MDIYSLYWEVCLRLKIFCEIIDEEKKHISESDILLKKEKQELKTELEEFLDDIEKKQKILEAYIAIAKAHTSQRITSASISTYNNSKLAKISVQIGNSYNDVYATQLFTEATAQQQFLQFEEKRIRESIHRQILDTEEYFFNKKNESDKKINTAIEEAFDFVNDSKYRLFIEKIKETHIIFDLWQTDTGFGTNDFLEIGEISLSLPVRNEFVDELTEASQGLFDSKDATISIPYLIDLPGCVLVADYCNANEQNLLDGVKSLLMNIARYYHDEYEQIVYIDPVRYNDSGLGCVAELCKGRNSFITAVPTSVEEIRNSIKLIVDTLNNEEHLHGSSIVNKQTHKRKLYVFHNFPQGYDETVVSKIRQLCVNAEYYGISVILTNNIQLRNTSATEVLEYIKVRAKHIQYTNGKNQVYDNNTNSLATFKWLSSPNSLPNDVKQRFILSRPVKNTSNNYAEHFNLCEMPVYHKGNRTLANIPYGIDSDGNILYLDFENTNFATFICGASRSGKSSLLHTIITGILKNNHPDDVEVWLIDFKMTEFSHYTDNLPPHVRYVILDESPELVYDIVDRLTEILLKRQNIFKGKWDKLSDVPDSKYMPALFVIIDEFSVMSQIIADSVTSGRDNYVVKMQTLLAKGAALGMHFIFASQGFTAGSRGLNDFAKKQIQQRIAMKTEVAEIKATLDLQSIGDDDRAKMEQLPVHHTLVKSRVPIDNRGNYLIYSKVLYISDKETQQTFVNIIKSNLSTASKYSNVDESTYIDKQSMVVDGNRYAGFINSILEMKEVLEDVADEDAILFIGEPRRMMRVYPIVLGRNYCENALIIGSHKEEIAMASLMLSVTESLKLQSIRLSIMSSYKNNIISAISKKYRPAYIDDIETICQYIKQTKQQIERRIFSNEICIVLGLETIFADMIFSVGGETKKENTTNYISPRLDEEVDLLTRMERGDAPDPVSATSITVQSNDNFWNVTSDVYDAREDLKFILKQGPKLGYRFVLMYNSTNEFSQTKLETSLFNHRMFFRTPRIDANGIVDSNNATTISELPDHCLRYTNGLNSLSFRPYLHLGINIDGWEMSEHGNVDIVEDEDDYLL